MPHTTSESFADTETLACLAQIPVMAELDADTARRIAARAERRVLRPGEHVFSQGKPAQHIFFLVQGKVRIDIGEASDEGILGAILTAPAVFGEAEAMSRTRWTGNAEAVRPTTVLCFNVNDFEAIIASSPRLAVLLYRDVCHRFREVLAGRSSDAHDDGEVRLALLLLGYARAFGTRVRDGVQIGVSGLTDAFLGKQVAGSSRRSVQRIMSNWTDRGLVRREGRALVVDMGGLEDVVNRQDANCPAVCFTSPVLR